MNRLSSAAVIAIALWGTTILAVKGHAQEQISDARVTGKTLDDAALQEMLLGLGYEPKKLTKGFLITAKEDTWTYYVQFVISNDHTRLGMNANLGSVPTPDDVTAAQWRDLLIQNNEIDPSSFNFDKDQKKLYMHRVLDNRAITPAYIRQQIDNFCGNIKSTAKYWNFVK